jgi:hypothetical protein
MTLPTRKTLLANAVSLLALAWLYGGDLGDALRVRDAEVAGFLHPPSILMPALVLLVTAAAVGAGAWGLLRRQGEDFKGYRVLPIVLVAALLVDLVRSESAQYLDSAELTVAALHELRSMAAELATEKEVPADPAVLGRLVEKLGPAPYLVRGQPVGAFTLQVREGCTGPVRELSGARPGTLLYCVAPERREAWVSVVGLPVGQRFGSAGLLSAEGAPLVLRVEPRPPAGPSSELLASPDVEAGDSPPGGGVVGAGPVP